MAHIRPSDTIHLLPRMIRYHNNIYSPETPFPLLLVISSKMLNFVPNLSDILLPKMVLYTPFVHITYG